MIPSNPHPAALSSRKLLESCEMRRLRRGGPGGQHRNKVETGVVLLHRPTGVGAEANERRSQAANRSVALFRLRVNLALAVRRSEALDPRPSPMWRSRCPGGGRIHCNGDHDDFPAMLAEALDVTALCEDDTKRAAEVLGCSVSQLVKFLKKEPRALSQVNQHRLDRGLGLLK